jgi:hypothetical protein
MTDATIRIFWLVDFWLTMVGGVLGAILCFAPEGFDFSRKKTRRGQILEAISLIITCYMIYRILPKL